MTKHELARALAAVQKSLAVRLNCTETWNGFIAGSTYDAAATHHHGRWVLGATDGHGLLTPITESAAVFFQLASEVPALLTGDEEAAAKLQQNRETLKTLYGTFTAPARQYKVGDFLEWIPGLCNRVMPSRRASMVVTEVLSPPASTPEKDPSSPDYSDVCDLRVACLAKHRGREDEDHLVEVCVDSRRVQMWGTSQ